MTTPRNLLLASGLLAVAGAAAGGYWMLRTSEPGWTTESPEALAEFEAGFADMSKFYWADAARHFYAALELDPGFMMAKLQLTYLVDEAERRALWEELEATDREPLNAEERFLLEYRLAVRDENAGGEAAAALLDAFLDRHPESLLGLRARCEVAWREENFERAEACYRRLLALHPNWVQGHNRLGYIAMARGRFTEAEEHFRTYRYIAPDQSNPHDSMAELLILLGRYREAEDALAAALRIKPDFCHAYILRARLGIFSDRLDLVEKAVADYASIPSCASREAEGFECSSQIAVRWLRGDAEGAWQLMESACPAEYEIDPFAYRAALQTGRIEACLAMEESLRELQAKTADEGRPVAARSQEAFLAHLEGVRALAGGDVAGAIERLTAADEIAGYWGYGERASFKLLNRIDLLRALEAGGEKTRADALRRKIEAVNPRILHEFQLPEPGRVAAG